MFLRCIFAHVCGRDYSLELIMLVSRFHKQSLLEKEKKKKTTHLTVEEARGRRIISAHCS